MKRIMTIVLTVLLTLSLVACNAGEKPVNPGDTEPQQTDAAMPQETQGTPENTGTEEKNMVNYGVDAELTTMDVHVVTDGTSYTIIENTMEGLTQFDKDSNIVPAIAESWDISPDGLTYTFHIRESAMWSNGEPVTAQDFVYSWRRLVNPETASENQFLIADTSGILNASAIAYEGAAVDTLGVEATDERTLVVTLERPVPVFLSLLLFPPFYPVNQAFCETHGAMFGQSVEHTLANGAFMLTYWDQGGSLSTVERNPYYYAKDEVTVDGVNFVVIKDAQSALLAYQNGDVDKIAITGELVEQYLNDPECRIVDGSFLWYVICNHRNEFLSNPNVRLALATCFDKPELCDGVLKDGSHPANYFVPSMLATGPDGKDFRDGAPTYLEFDKDKALEYWNAAKAELNFETMTLSLLVEDTESAIGVATYLQDAMQKNLPGLTISLETMAKKARLQREREANYDLSLTRWGPDYADPMTYLDQFVTTKTKIGWTNTRYDEMIEEASSGQSALDPAVRWKLLHDIETELLKEAAVLPVYQKNNALLQKSYLTGIEEHASIGNLFKRAIKAMG